ncbi:hypothetical protein BC938DRAFT_470761 [Jimgerdemannia flammicorona]|uniref:Uncharacterized protein n=1 Tax=Jimgerdemannia flammicorona TaxID=994334 RepID=A0A433Q9M1_9FUNG|nr:hypothetical protein BC938DRAFT_470761 [Jimgerdemannia flammicorona]
MQFPPECRDALRFPDFWEGTDEPSLREFLDFRLSAGDLKDEVTEHHNYSTDLNKLSKFYAEVSEMGKKILKWRNTLKSLSVKYFWEVQQRRHNINIERQLIKEQGLLDFEETGLRRLRDTSSAVHNDHLQHYTRSKRQLSEEETKSLKRIEVDKARDPEIQGLDILNDSDLDEVESGYFEYGQDYAEEAEFEPTFVVKLRNVLEEAKKSGNDFDKKLAALGIICISSRKTLQEPCSMRKKVKSILTDKEHEELRDILQLSNIDIAPLANGDTLQDLRRIINSLELTTTTDILIRRIYDHFCCGLEGRGELSKSMEERQLTVKYIQPLFDWAFQDISDFDSFWCEKGNRDLIKSRDIDHNLWDGVFCDESTIFMEKPHTGLVEVSGGTEGCSVTKLKEDLLKLAKGMRRHLKRVAITVSGDDLGQCCKLKVVGSQCVGNRLYMQAMCCVGNRVFVMWEWNDAILPRTLIDMALLSRTIRSVLVFKQTILETRHSIEKMKEAENCCKAEILKSGFSSPIREAESPWRDWFVDV